MKDWLWRVVFLGITLGILVASVFLVGWFALFLYGFVGVSIWLVGEGTGNIFLMILCWPMVIASKRVRDWYVET